MKKKCINCKKYFKQGHFWGYCRRLWTKDDPIDLFTNDDGSCDEFDIRPCLVEVDQKFKESTPYIRNI